VNTYYAFIEYELKLTFRYRMAIALNYLFPICLFVGYSEMFRPAGLSAGGPGNGGAVYVGGFFNMCLVIAALSNGLWGTGLRAVSERENNILRRFKVTPISPLPLLVSLIVSGWAVFMPIGIVLGLFAHLRYGMPFPAAWPSLLLFISLGVVAFRCLGLIIAGVANSTQETNAMIQLLFMPMLFLSGATIPLGLLPLWARAIATFMPSYHLMQICQAVFQNNLSVGSELEAVTALTLTALLGAFVSWQLFRWDKDQKIRPAAKLLVLMALLPFAVLGAYQIQRGQYGQIEPYLSSKPGAWGTSPAGDSSKLPHAAPISPRRP
jgi:ABC-type multidrug transport system permease subunit